MPDAERRALLQAGAESVRFNSPMGPARAENLADVVAAAGGLVVDLGCGRGAFALLVAARSPTVHVVGVDLDRERVGAAERDAVTMGVDARTTFVVRDLAAWTGPADAVACFGASHALGGAQGLCTRLRTATSAAVAAVGDTFWTGERGPWDLEAFGPQPLGLDGLVAAARASGWRVVEATASTQAEWDDFEDGWAAGVTAVGTHEARAFAHARRAEYRARYRGRLGFGWLVLERA